MNKNIILSVGDLTKDYGSADSKTEALRGISFDVLDGEFLGIMGASGSGKTTLLNCIATMTKPTSGRILLKDIDMSSMKGDKLAEYRGKEIGYLFQEFELLDNLTAKENILLPLSIHGITGSSANNALSELVSYFDIREVMHKFPSQMSGGQKQRVAAARSLILNPSIVLADEPTGALDSKNSKILMDKLIAINESHRKTILMVTHDSSAASYCSRILFIRDGRLYHELRRKIDTESRDEFYERIVSVTTLMGGGTANVI